MPVDSSFRVAKNARNKVRVRMKCTQLPFMINNATAVHKLQGAAKERMFLSTFWCRPNWPCVALSRAKTRKGLFLRKPLDPSKDCSVDANLEAMTEWLEEHLLLPPLSQSSLFIANITNTM